MLCNSETNRNFQASQVLYLTLLVLYLSVQLSITSSVSNTDYSTTDTMLTNNITNDSTGDDLYVIKAVVYEIGILTDADNSTDDTTERQEEVKLEFYNPPNASKGP
ncbi:hypothetical protein ANTPLA_LOCUS3211 [Anthophora plagiata]